MGLLLLVGLVYGLRTFSAATINVSVREVKPGVHCALAVTADGVAIDCWKMEEE